MAGQLVPVDAEVARLAGLQHGVVARWQLLEIGLGKGAIDGRVGRGRLHVIHRGVYAVGHRRLSERGVWMSAVLACGPEAWLSHNSGGALLDLCADSTVTHVLVQGQGSRIGGKGIVVHRSRGPVTGMHHDGIPVTSVERTLLDLADVLDERRLQRAVEAGERSQLLNLRKLGQLIETSKGRRGRTTLTRILERHGYWARPTRRELERRFLDLCEGAGLPPPHVNAEACGYEVDAFWPEQKLIVELDSFEFHRTRAAFERDRQRDAVLQLAGYRVLRVTWRRLHAEPKAVAAAIRALLRCRPR